MKVLVTGSAGFIGFSTALKLLEKGVSVIGLDNLNSYYKVSLKNDRLRELRKYTNFDFHRMDITDKDTLVELFSHFHPDYVMNFAAQAGVR